MINKNGRATIAIVPVESREPKRVDEPDDSLFFIFSGYVNPAIIIVARTMRTDQVEGKPIRPIAKVTIPKAMHPKP